MRASYKHNEHVDVPVELKAYFNLEIISFDKPAQDT